MGGMSQPSSDSAGGVATPRSALMMARVIWAALLMGVVIAGVMMLLTFGGRASQGNASMVPFMVSLVMAMTLLPAAYVVRAMMYRKSAVDGVVPPEKFLPANILFMAMIEGPMFTGLVMATVMGELFPTIVVPVVLLVVYVLNFPTGRVMAPKLANPYEMPAGPSK